MLDLRLLKRRLLAFTCLSMILSSPAVASPLGLKEQTIDDWNNYLQVSKNRMNQRANGGAAFLWLDSVPDGSRRLQAGDILVEPFSAQTPIRVTNGLIHHWVGASFVRGATIDDVLSVIRNYSHYKDYYGPVVIDSGLDGTQSASLGSEEKFHVRLRNKTLLSKTALDASYTASYVHLDAQRCYVTAYTTQLEEIDHYEQKSERRLPPDQGNGYIWRLYSTTRFAERDGGVYIEVEAIALSRDIPAAARWLVEPIVRRISRDALTTSLDQTGRAARASMNQEAGIGVRPAPVQPSTNAAFFVPRR